MQLTTKTPSETIDKKSQENETQKTKASIGLRLLSVL